ncbi:MAG: hypothetical protein RI894_175, partial [Bacteroidota bacterium]
TLLFSFAALVCSFSSFAQTVVAGRIIAQNVRLLSDSSYSFRVQTIAVQQVLENKLLENTVLENTVLENTLQTTIPRFIQLVSPLGRVLRYDDGSLAIPSLATSDAELPFCNEELGIWTLADANSSVFDKANTLRFRLLNFAFEESGEMPSAEVAANLGQTLYFATESIFLHKSHQPIFAEASNGHSYSTKQEFRAFLKQKKWTLDEKLFRQTFYEYNNYFAIADNALPIPQKGGLKHTAEIVPESFSFSPASVVAGSGDILTIRAGKDVDFGQKKGNVYFTNAEMGLCNKRFYTNSCDSLDIISWSRSEIKMKVPSNIVTAYFMEHAGTGPLSVETADKKRIYYNRTSLVVPYSLVTERLDKKTIAKDRWYFANYHCDRGLTFAIDTTTIYKLTTGHLPSYRDSLIQSIGAAIRHWQRLLPGVELRLSPNFIQQPYNTDKHIRIISFSDDGFNAYREMYSYTSLRPFKTASESTEKNVSIRSNLEINVRPTLIAGKIPYWVDTTLTLDKPVNKRDFYCTILHEIGHLLGLQHTLNSSTDGTRDVMAMLTCAARMSLKAALRPSPTSCFGGAQEGASMVFHDSRLLRWSNKQGQVTTLGSFTTPQSLSIYKHPQSKLVCNSSPIGARFEVSPVSKMYSYEWQTRAGKRAWTTMTENVAFKGEKTAVLHTTPQFTSSDGVGRQFRCLISFEGCTAYSETARYSVGVEQNMPFRLSGISEDYNKPIELPKGSPDNGIYEGIGVTGAGGKWFFTPGAVPSAGLYSVMYKVRDEQLVFATAQKTGEYCISSQSVKVLNTKELQKTSPVFIKKVAPQIDIRKGQPSTQNILIDGASSYKKDCFFLVQLSDENGYFATTTIDSLPNIIGFVNNPLFAEIPITLAPTVFSGRKYRMRIIQTAPFAISADNGKDILIYNPLLQENDKKSTLPFASLLKK